MKKNIVTQKLGDVSNYVHDVANGDSPFNVLYNARNDAIKDLSSGRINYPKKVGIAELGRVLSEVSSKTERPYLLGTPEQIENMIKEEQRKEKMAMELEETLNYFKKKPGIGEHITNYFEDENSPVGLIPAPTYRWPFLKDEKTDE